MNSVEPTSAKRQSQQWHFKQFSCQKAFNALKKYRSWICLSHFTQKCVLSNERSVLITLEFISLFFLFSYRFIFLLLKIISSKDFFFFLFFISILMLLYIRSKKKIPEQICVQPLVTTFKPHLFSCNRISVKQRGCYSFGLLRGKGACFNHGSRLESVLYIGGWNVY